MTKNKIQDVFGLSDVESTSIDLENFAGTGNDSSPFSPAYKKITQAIDYSSIDNYVYDELMSRSTNLRGQVEEYQKGGPQFHRDGTPKLDHEGNPIENKAYEPFEDLAKDVFQSFYKHSPKFRDEQKLNHHGKYHQQLMQSYMQTEEYQNLHRKTKHDAINAAIASQTAYAVLHEKIQYMLQQQSEPGNNPNQPPSERDMNDLQNQMKSAINDISKGIDETEGLMKSYGLDKGQNQPQSYKEKTKMLQEIRQSRKFREFSELVGRYRELSKKIFESKERQDSPTIQSVTSGNDIVSLMASELALLQNPQTKALFYKKYLEKQLLMYEKYDIADSSRGPIVVCVDTSGSMQGDKEKWSKAVALALLEMATLQKRDYACVFFCSDVGDVVEIPHGEANYQQIIHIAEFFTNGGTNFTKPVRKALSLIENNARFKKADIVFITDDEATLRNPTELNEKKRKLGVRFQTVLIGHYDKKPEHYSLKEITDNVMIINEFANFNAQADEMTEDILTGV